MRVVQLLRAVLKAKRCRLLYAPCARIECSLYTYCMRIACALYVHFMHIIQLLYAHGMLIVCALLNTYVKF